MMLKIRRAGSVAVVLGTAGAWFAAGSALADAHHRRGHVAFCRYVHVASPGTWVAGRPATPSYDRAAPQPYRVDGYFYIPGKGIAGEGCNLPSSACPNSARDVQ